MAVGVFILWEKYVHNIQMFVCISVTASIHLIMLANIHDTSLQLYGASTTVLHTPVQVSLSTAPCNNLRITNTHMHMT